MKKKKIDLSTILLILVLIAGLSLLLYPSVSDYWNSFHSSQVISAYVENVADLDQERYEELWSAAWDYNRSLLERSTGFALTDEQREEYEALLDVTGLGVMGYLEIPKISVSLPVYHGVEETILQTAVGHLDWSSLPVGGTDSHCVLSGHRALPSARLFTDLDKLQEGDIFLLRILDEILTYEVDQISVVEPHDVTELKILPGEDLCTLVTCTPYGINTHRLLVRGHRIDNLPQSRVIRVTADAMQLEPLLVAPVVAVPILLLLLLLALLPRKTGFREDGGEELM